MRDILLTLAAAVAAIASVLFARKRKQERKKARHVAKFRDLLEDNDIDLDI